MKNKSNTYPTDDEAEAEAAEARRQGTQLIENHLSMHLSQNPDSSFVTWIATLHPENAEVSIDQRFFVPNNPWWTVYEGAKNDIPIATAVPVNDDLAAASEQPIPVSTYNPEKPVSTSSSTKTEPKSPCSPIDSFIGFVLSLIAILTVFGLETSACIIYFVAAGIWKSAKAMGHTGLIPWILYHVLMIVYWILAIIDSCLLLGSVLAVELVAGVCYILSLLFAGCQRAAAWHQYIRRTPCGGRFVLSLPARLAASVPAVRQRDNLTTMARLKARQTLKGRFQRIQLARQELKLPQLSLLKRREPILMRRVALLMTTKSIMPIN